MTHLRTIQPTEFDALAQGSPSPVVALLEAGWCAPCDLMGPILESLAREFADQAAFVKLDAEEDPTLARRLGISSVPTLLVFRDGQEIIRKVGACSNEELRALLRRVLQ